MTDPTLSNRYNQPGPLLIAAQGGQSTIARALKSIYDQYAKTSHWTAIQEEARKLISIPSRRRHAQLRLDEQAHTFSPGSRRSVAPVNVSNAIKDIEKSETILVTNNSPMARSLLAVQ